MAGIETAILKAHAETNRDGPITCTVAAGWTTTAGNVSAITLTMGSATKTQTFNADELIGRHLLQSDIARRITDSGATASGVTALTTAAFGTAPTNASADIRDGFHKCPDDMLLVEDAQDRHFQVVHAFPVRDPSHGVQGTRRSDVLFDVQVMYEYSQDKRQDILRAGEDAESITDVLLDGTNAPSGGVTLFPAGEPEFDEIELEDGSEPTRFVMSLPMSLSYLKSSLED